MGWSAGEDTNELGLADVAEALEGTDDELGVGEDFGQRP